MNHDLESQCQLSNAMAQKACGMPPINRPDHYLTPTICRRCDAQITPETHTLQQCESNQTEKARISAEYRRAARTLKERHEANDRAAFKLQIQEHDTVGEV